LRAHLLYLRYVLRHKWFVFVAGLFTGAPLWRLIVHDWSKFTPSEWFAYARFFYGKPRAENPVYSAGVADRYAMDRERRQHAFDVAWLHHQKRNKHHWQYWVLMEDSPEGGRYALGTPNNVDYSIRDCTVLGELGRMGEVWIRGTYDEVGQAQYMTANGVVRDANRYRALPMPERYVREMVADWMGAGRAITGKWDAPAWYEQNKYKMVLHPDARGLVEALLAGLVEELLAA